MKVVHIGKFFPPRMGGMETHLRALATRLKDRVEVEVLVANDERRTVRELCDGVLVTRAMNVGTIASTPFCPSLALEMRRRKTADIFHLHTPNPSAALAYLASGHSGSLVITHHADVVGRRHLKKMCDPVVRRVMARAAAIIVTSRRYAETSVELMDFRDKCRVVPLAFDPSTLGQADPAMAAQLRAEHGPGLLLAIGRLVSYKGFEYLIRAMQSVSGKLLLVGSGPLRSRLEQVVTDLGLDSRVRFFGHVDNITPFYEAADIVVVPSISRAEAFGIVQLEAMSFGKPVINTDLDSGVPEVSPHGRTGLTVPPGDSAALAGAINELLGSPSQRQVMGSAGRARISTEYDADLMLRRILAIYEDVCCEKVGLSAKRSPNLDSDGWAGRVGFE